MERTRRLQTALASALIVLGLLAALVSISQNQRFAQLSPEQWKNDLRFMVKELSAKHKNLFHTVTRADFNRAAMDVEARLPALSPERTVLEFKRLVGMVGDARTRISLSQPVLRFRPLPVALFMYPEGLYVIRTMPQYKAAVGARVVNIGSGTVEAVLAAVRSFASRDNDMSEKVELATLVTVPQLLHALGFTSDAQRATFVLEDARGGRFTVAFDAAEELDPKRSVNIWDASGTIPLGRDGIDRNYWFTYLDGSQTLYMQYNLVLNDGQQPFESFCNDLFQFADSHPVERLVIDLRSNIGGNGQLNKALIDALRKRNLFTQPDRLFVLIGRRTFSAGLMAAVDLKHGRFFREKSDPVREQRTKTILVGEPTGAKPNSYSERGEITLPASGIVVSYSKLFWELAPEMGNAPALQPDVVASPSLDADRNGRDPAIEAVLSWRKRV